MSLGGVDQGGESQRFPRVSGDEPSTPRLQHVYHEFSPRERG